MYKSNNYKKAFQFTVSKKYMRKMKKRLFYYRNNNIFMLGKYASRLLIRTSGGRYV